MQLINKNIFFTTVILLFCLTTNNVVAKKFSLFDKRFDTLKKDAEAGNKRAQYKLGLAYLTGSEVKVNLKTAILWFTKSARQGYVKAYHKLGVIYYENRNKSGKYALGFRWMLKAGSREFGVSQYYLSLMYLQGRGVRKDIDRSLYWATKAKKNGVRNAGKLIVKIEEAIGNSTQKHKKSKRSKLNVSKKNESQKNKNQKNRHSKNNSKATTQVKKARTKRRYANHLKRTMDTILAGGWKLDKKPAYQFPSEIATCNSDPDSIRCKTERIKKVTRDYQAHYSIDTLITGFQKNRVFLVRYRYNYIFVLPFDADDPNPSYFIPVVGEDKTITSLRCQLIHRKRINCKNDKGQKFKYTK